FELQRFLMPRLPHLLQLDGIQPLDNRRS
ncbi:hypothetical protein AE94_05620, partial [Klebsiella pneumoniae CHS 38]